MTDVLTCPLNVSKEAEGFARAHFFSGSLNALKTLVLRDTTIISQVNVELVRDPEVSNRVLISFDLSTNHRVPEVLEFDEHLRGVMHDEIPAADRAYFAIHFNFV